MPHSSLQNTSGNTFYIQCISFKKKPKNQTHKKKFKKNQFS